MIQAINEILTRDLNQFQPWMVASFAFAYSTVEMLNAEVLKVVEEELFQHDDLTPFATNDLVMLVLAFARVQKLHPILLKLLETVMVKRRDYKETVVEDHSQEMHDLLTNSELHLAVLVSVCWSHVFGIPYLTFCFGLVDPGKKKCFTNTCLSLLDNLLKM